MTTPRPRPQSATQTIKARLKSLEVVDETEISRLDGRVVATSDAVAPELEPFAENCATGFTQRHDHLELEWSNMTAGTVTVYRLGPDEYFISVALERL